MIAYTIASIGLTFILKYSTILKPIRSYLCRWKWFDELFSCSLCLGFWVGLYIGILGVFIEQDIRYGFMCLIAPACCWFSDTVLTLLQTIEIYLDKKLEDNE